MAAWQTLMVSTPGLALVAPMAAGALAILRWGISRHDAQFAKRKEFLQNWKDPDALDDLSIEVLVRQLTGTYLPALLVRRVCRRKRSEITKTLMSLATIWSLVDWHSDSGTASWKKSARSHPVRFAKGLLLTMAYFSLGTLGATALTFVILKQPAMIIAFGSAAWGLLLIGLAFAALWTAEPWETAAKSSDALLDLANDETPLFDLKCTSCTLQSQT
ncbi:hypothetical protein JY423_02200 [Stenotrophomonas maltophilia]|uniref:Uncharacterized protein n=1 Tax=Knufia peltigerae TaxID=1002370 RepID=A0AA39CV18_9EURO|nr:hypothetical protein H2204_008154 [Knufia peltigerae]MBH1494006.1 hypothetical protein [Stenotrophomonas maltophilia]MBN4961071.1 hypothetical protein [Stenotrophomonas maltophilia]